MQRTGRSFKETVNDALRNGLDSARSTDRPRVELPTFPLRARPGVELDDIGALLERAEGPEHP